jgi:hypothetical protein
MNKARVRQNEPSPVAPSKAPARIEGEVRVREGSISSERIDLRDDAGRDVHRHKLAPWLSYDPAGEPLDSPPWGWSGRLHH